MKRVLVTGGAGFIGSHLVDRLVQDNHQVTVLDNLSNGTTANIRTHIRERKVALIYGDIRDCDLVKKCVENQDYVVHLAAIADVPLSVVNPEETFSVNVDGTENLLRASVRRKVQKIIFASSCAVYGEPDRLPMSENDPLKPASPYAESKAKASQFCHHFRETYGMNTVCLQLFNVYGPRQGSKGGGGVIPRFIRSLVRDQPPIIYGDGEQTRDFIFVRDAVKAIYQILEATSNDDSYNVGSGISTSINELLELFQDLTGRKLKRPVHALSRPGDIKRSQADIHRLMKGIHYAPETSLENGLRVVLQRLGQTAESLSGRQ